MIYGLIGEKLGHSYSPEIHAKIADYNYELRELPPDALERFLKERDFCGINVTIPYKQTVIPYLDSISDEARSIGAVNTIVNRDGKLYGYNTDFMGMSELLSFAGIDPRGKKALILGTGGTSKTARAVLESMGAREIINVSRRGGDAILTYDEAYVNASDTEIIINTTPVGMFPDSNSVPIDIRRFSELRGVADAVYNPLRTNLILDAQSVYIPAQGGLYMLVAQAVYASALFRCVEPERKLIPKIYRSILHEKRNIVLIGMPSCGKSTVGAIISERTGKRMLDTDALICEENGSTPSDIITSQGEKAFRDIESGVIEKTSSMTGCVIATGGGAVLREKNVRALMRNGVIIFINRSLEKLITTDDRPLSANREKLAALYEARYDIYKRSAERIINGNGTPEEVADAILAALD